MQIDIDYTCEQLDDLLGEPATMRVKNFLLDLRNGICPPLPVTEEVSQGIVRKEYV